MSDDTPQTPQQNSPKPNAKIDKKALGFTSDNLGRNDRPSAIEDIMHFSYLQYSLSVNVGRAIPDVRDGMKPGMRRILYAMHELGFNKSHKTEKCAKVVGAVIGNYHPHGDQAVYDTLARMAQDFAMRAPLIEGQGNFGSIDGDPPAAYRYTECRMERLAEELLADLDKDTVDMVPNFDDTLVEPAVLPAKFPNLLVNGSTGIGVGMATNIPPHNLGEVIDATVALIDNPRIAIRELMRHLPGPDFPTGGTIQGIRSIIQLYETGRGSVRLRGKATIEENNGREQIVITEIPYAINKEELVKKIVELVNDKRIVGISNIIDISSSEIGVRIVIDVKRGAPASVVLNQLYALSPLESNLPAQFLVVDKNRPRTLNLKQILEAYLDHREEVVTRRTRYLLKIAEERDHIVQGLLIAQAHIDEVVRIIRSSPNRDAACAALQQSFPLSERQAKAILEMRLYQLTNLIVEQLQNEHNELQQRIAYYNRLLADRAEIIAVIRDELLDVKAKYSDPRRTLIVPGESEINMEDLIAREICVIPITASGYIKRVAASNYESINRGGKGFKGMKTKDEDFVTRILTCCTHDTILFFTSKGLMRWLKAYDIPEGSRESQGKALVNLLQLEPDEKIRAFIAVPTVEQENRFVVMVTRNGVIKKTELMAFRHLMKKGIIAISLAPDDDLIDAALTDGANEILLTAANGMACRFRETDIRPMGRQAAGVRGMNLRDANGNLISNIVSMAIVNDQDELLVITENGFGKRTPIGRADADADDASSATPATDDAADDDANAAPDSTEEADAAADDADDTARSSASAWKFRLTRRGGKGVVAIKLRAGDKVVAAFQIEQNTDKEIILTSIQGLMPQYRIADFRLCGRAAYGTIIMRLNEGDKVASAAIVDELSEEEIAANTAKARENAENQAREAEFAARLNALQQQAQQHDDDDQQDGDEQ
ncbi:MAG: DNA gyrase subunit A [Oligosphaeraceae bacterium]